MALHEKNKMFPIIKDLDAILYWQKDKEKRGVTGWKWGWRIHPIKKTKSWHNGIDLPALIGTPMYAPYDCLVIRLWKDSLNGNALKLFHPNNNYVVETAYAHMDHMPKYLKYCKKENILIKAGMLIGYIGDKGKTTGPHLHFVTRQSNAMQTADGLRRDIDPLSFLEDSLK